MTATPGPRLVLALASISLVGSLALHLFIPAIPVVKTALGLSDALAQLTFSIAVFSMAFSTLVYGSFSDRYGRRPILLLGLGLFLIGSAFSAAADSALTLLVGRLVQAIGRLWRDPGSRHRPGRLWPCRSRQGHRISHNVLHNRSDDLAIGRRLFNRLLRLAQCFCFRVGSRHYYYSLRLHYGVRISSVGRGKPPRRECFP